MALPRGLSPLSKDVVMVLRQAGFKQIQGRPFEFIGVIPAQTEDLKPMAGLLTVMPLKIRRDEFVVSLEVNGEVMVQTRIVKLDDIVSLVGYSGVVKEILTLKGE
jgi:hypothetical protein